MLNAFTESHIDIACFTFERHEDNATRSARALMAGYYAGDLNQTIVTTPQ